MIGGTALRCTQHCPAAGRYEWQTLYDWDISPYSNLLRVLGRPWLCWLLQWAKPSWRPWLNLHHCSIPSPSPDVQSESVSECCSIQTAVSSLQVSLSGSPPACSTDPAWWSAGWTWPGEHTQNHNHELKPMNDNNNTLATLALST